VAREHGQRRRQQPLADFVLVRRHIEVDQAVEIAGAAHAERGDPHITGNAVPGAQACHQRPEHRCRQQRGQQAQRIAPEQPGEQMAARIAVVQGVVEVEHDQRRIVGGAG
jgi:hypothetical protein